MTVILLIDFLKKKLKPYISVVEYIPTPLLVVGGSTLITWLLALDTKGVVILVRKTQNFFFLFCCLLILFFIFI